MSNIVISGYYGSKNAGDEAMLASMVEVLSDLDSKVNITVISASPADTQERHGVHAVGWLDFVAICRALKSADILLSGGGSLLQNITSRRSLYYYLMIIWLAQLLGTPVMLYAQGVGPIKGAAARRIMGWIGNRVQMITVRDKGSLKELEALGITRPHIEATADPVHAIHQVDTVIGREILKKNKVFGDRPVIGISVRDWCGWTRYKSVIAEAINRIDKEYGANIVFFPMQYPEDVRAAESIAEMTDCGAVVLKDEYTTSELLSIVGNLDLLIGIRLHALIFAGVMGVPMIGISYDPKIDRFLDSIGDTPAGNLEEIKVRDIMDRVKLKWNRKQEFCSSNMPMCNHLRSLARHNADLAFSIIKKNN